MIVGIVVGFVSIDGIVVEVAIVGLIIAALIVVVEPFKIIVATTYFDVVGMCYDDISDDTDVIV